MVITLSHLLSQQMLYLSLLIDWASHQLLPLSGELAKLIIQRGDVVLPPPPLTHFVYSLTHHPLEGVTDSKELTHLLTLVNPISSWLICENYPSVIKIRYEGHSAQPQ